MAIPRRCAIDVAAGHETNPPPAHINPPVPPQPSSTPDPARASLEDALRELPCVGTLVKDRAYRQVWRFEHGGKAYFLKYYPKGGVRDRWRRRFRGSPALREFFRLQWLQKANVAAPRAVAFLKGLRLNDRVGDAVILQALEPAVQLDEYLTDLALRGERTPNHRELSRQIRELMFSLGKAGLGHEDLHLGNFLLSNGKIYLLDAYAVTRGGLKTNHVLQLGLSVSRFATRTDLLRGWRDLGGGLDKLPTRNRVAERRYNTFMQKVTGDNRYFGRLLDDVGWEGVTFKRTKFPRAWSAVSRLQFTTDEWRGAWTTLRKQVEADSLEVLKRTASGDVLAGELTIGSHKLPVIVKHPRRKYWYRWINEIGRGSRARRAWMKSWQMIARHIPVAWPLLLVERRTLGYVTDGLIVFERVPGAALHKADLDAMTPAARDTLLRRVGRVLRRIDDSGFAHFDAKSSNFIALDDARLVGSIGPTPVMVDMDGIRRRRWVGLGVERLLRAMKQHPQYTPADSLAICQGYAPFSPTFHEPKTEDEVDDGTQPH
jgi:tRNA A-37 threonylcarbamoyl transferase component Bud32